MNLHCSPNKSLQFVIIIYSLEPMKLKQVTVEIESDHSTLAYKFHMILALETKLVENPYYLNQPSTKGSEVRAAGIS